MDFGREYAEYKELFEKSIWEALNNAKDIPKTLRMAFEYSLVSGGKRLRPVLFVSVIDGLYGKNPEKYMSFASALEMIHTYSLIHDDLPALDNDDYRRGRLTNHRVFGEAQAILTGDAMLNMAYELMIDNVCQNSGDVKRHLRAMKIIAHACGPYGMIGGQIAEIEGTLKGTPPETLNYIYRLKTAALIEASLTSAAVLAGASEREVNALSVFGDSVGIAFQIIDDILDDKSEGTVRECSNMCGKLTYPAIFGVEGSQRIAVELVNSALEQLSVFDDRKRFLSELALNTLKRHE